MKNFLLSMFTNIFSKRNTGKRKAAAFEAEILRLRYIVENLEKNYSELAFVVKNQSELLSTVAGIQSDMIGAFVLGADNVGSPVKKTSTIGSVLFLPPEDDDILN